MHVVVCFVFPSPHFALATGFRFTVMPLLHECHCMFCFPLPPFEFANGFRFTAIPLLHECTNCTNYLQCACPFHRNQAMPCVAGTFLTVF